VIVAIASEGKLRVLNQNLFISEKTSCYWIKFFSNPLILNISVKVLSFTG